MSLSELHWTIPVHASINFLPVQVVNLVNFLLKFIQIFSLVVSILGYLIFVIVYEKKKKEKSVTWITAIYFQTAVI